MRIPTLKTFCRLSEQLVYVSDFTQTRTKKSAIVNRTGREVGGDYFLLEELHKCLNTFLC